MSYFSYVGKLFSNVKGFYNEINAATLTGAIDTLIIEQPDGSFKSSPFHVRFGKLGVLRSREKVVDIEINGVPTDIQMKLGETGEAFFVEEFEDEEEELPIHLATSPIAHDPLLMKHGLERLKKEAQGQIHDTVSTEIVEVTEVKVTEGDQVIKVEEEVKITIENVIPEENESKKTREHLDSVRSESTVKSDHSRDADIEIKIEPSEPVNNKSRKKKRKKRKNAGHNSQQKIDANSETQVNSESNPNNDDIFEMDDLSTDDELSRLTSTMTNGAMSKSISLPVVEESRLARTNEWASAHEGFSYLNSHPFSDTDLSPLASPQGSRPHTPKSDTEVERQKSLEQDCLIPVDDENERVTWEWGNLPQTTTKDDKSPSSPKIDDKTKTGGLFQFMRKTKNVRHKPETEGIYLDDLNINDMDEETAKLYFPKRFSVNQSFQCIQEKDEDVESGRGASLPVSPHSVEGAIGGPTSSGTILESEIRHLGAVSLSLCGGLSEPEPITLVKFMSKILTFDDLCENPTLLTSPELVVRIEDKYYNWATAAPLVVARMAFDRPLPTETIDTIASQYMPKKKEKKGSYSWFSWRRNDPSQHPTTAAPPTSDSAVPNLDPTVSKSDVENVSPVKSKESVPSYPSSETESPKKDPTVERLEVISGDHSSSEGDTEGSEKLGDSTLKVKKKMKRVCKRSLRLSSDRIKQLNLQPGQNEVVFSVTTQYQGTKRCQSHIYLWKYNDKIVISDIDGTITKSDVLGQILPVMGRDWSQSGVAQLYSRISGNGYKFLYLSARAIGQSKLTKDLLTNIRQGEMTLPEGPLLLSPISLISAFHKEVIERKPEEFKISCLTDIGNLFPDVCCPFYAGFGNKVNDVYAYKAINIPTFRIFTINPYGELKHELSYTFQSSYTKLTDVVDHFFPPVHKLPDLRANEYNQVQYWREPLPEISPVEIESVRSGKSSSHSNTPEPSTVS